MANIPLLYWRKGIKANLLNASPFKSEQEFEYNKHYYGCKIGNSIVFGVKWIGTRSYALFFKVPEAYARKIRVPGYKMHKYEKLWHEAVFAVTVDNLQLKRFKQLYQTALKQRMGKLSAP